jgi:hypothetical protein
VTPDALPGDSLPVSFAAAYSVPPQRRVFDSSCPVSPWEQKRRFSLAKFVSPRPCVSRVVLPRFPGGPAGLYLKLMLVVLKKCVHTWCAHHHLTLVIYGSPYQSHTTKCICVDLRFFFYFRKLGRAFCALVLKRRARRGVCWERKSERELRAQDQGRENIELRRRHWSDGSRTGKTQESTNQSCWGFVAH